MDVMYSLILKLSLVLTVGFIGGLVARKLKLPDVSGYLIFGLILGPSLGLIIKEFPGIITATDQNSLKFIGDISLSFIAFSIGSEFHLKTLKRSGRKVNIITIFEVLFVVGFVFIILFFIPKTSDIMNGYNPFSKENVAFGMILASMSAATAPAATLMVIRQYRAHGPVTKTILPVTALDDIYGIIVFGFFISIAQILVTGTSGLPIWLVILKPILEVFGSLLLGGLLGFLLSFLTNKIGKSRDMRQVMSITVILFSIGIVMLLNHLLNDYGISFSTLLVNIMVGSFVANLARKPQDTFNAINDLATPFYVLFFTLAGASLDLNIIKSSGLIIILSIAYIIARGSGKFSGATVGAKVAKAEPTVQKYLGFALLPQGGVSIGLLVIVLARMPEFYPLISTIIMLSILVYETSGPIFAKLAISKAGELYGLDKFELFSSIEGFDCDDPNDCPEMLVEEVNDNQILESSLDEEVLEETETTNELEKSKKLDDSIELENPLEEEISIEKEDAEEAELENFKKGE